MRMQIQNGKFLKINHSCLFCFGHSITEANIGYWAKPRKVAKIASKESQQATGI